MMARRFRTKEKTTTATTAAAMKTMMMMMKMLMSVPVLIYESHKRMLRVLMLLKKILKRLFTQ